MRSRCLRAKIWAGTTSGTASRVGCRHSRQRPEMHPTPTQVTPENMQAQGLFLTSQGDRHAETVGGHSPSRGERQPSADFEVRGNVQNARWLFRSLLPQVRRSSPKDWTSAARRGAIFAAAARSWSGSMARRVIPSHGGTAANIRSITGHCSLVVVDGCRRIDRRRPGISLRSPQEEGNKEPAELVNRQHLKLVEIERSLLIAGEVPGLKLKSTLARGQPRRRRQNCAARRWAQDLVTGSIGIDGIEFSPVPSAHGSCAALSLSTMRWERANRSMRQPDRVEKTYSQL